ncbi:MAG: hypothetical protein LQ337_005035 [Flavoplaca oasis]|nr:MAG: hypothetical protein LQ337_005035 [Flavoplaca oasis]
MPVHPFDSDLSNPLFPTTADNPSPVTGPSQLWLLYALIVAGIFVVLIIFGFLSLAFCNFHYETRMEVALDDRTYAAELATGYFKTLQYGTISQQHTRQDEMDGVAEWKDDRDTDSICNRLYVE